MQWMLQIFRRRAEHHADLIVTAGKRHAGDERVGAGGYDHVSHSCRAWPGWQTGRTKAACCVAIQTASYSSWKASSRFFLIDGRVTTATRTAAAISRPSESGRV